MRPAFLQVIFLSHHIFLHCSHKIFSQFSLFLAAMGFHEWLGMILFVVCPHRWKLLLHKRGGEEECEGSLCPSCNGCSSPLPGIFQKWYFIAVLSNLFSEYTVAFLEKDHEKRSASPGSVIPKDSHSFHCKIVNVYQFFNLSRWTLVTSISLCLPPNNSVCMSYFPRFCHLPLFRFQTSLFPGNLTSD